MAGLFLYGVKSVRYGKTEIKKAAPGTVPA